MPSLSSPAASTPGRARRAILGGGLLAGTGDLLFAFVYYGWRPGVMQSVAGGLLGRPAALAGGMPTFFLGVLLHYLIATVWAAIFWGLSRRAAALVRPTVPVGLAYGLVVFYGMNCVVLPLSALPAKAWPPPFAPWPLAAHAVLVGLPIALVAGRFSVPPAGAVRNPASPAPLPPA